jgi:phosphoribosylformylglycinamidine synthase
VTAVRQGKHFELEVAGDAAVAADVAHRVAGTLLANPVIEDFTVTVGSAATA